MWSSSFEMLQDDSFFVFFGMSQLLFEIGDKDKSDKFFFSFLVALGFWGF